MSDPGAVLQLTADHLMSADIAELAKALAAAQGEIRAALKAAENPHFNSQYADLSSIWAACRAPLARHGLSIVQMPYVADGAATVTTMLMHSSGQFIKGRDLALRPMRGRSEDPSPQGMGSAITYARRYALAAYAGVAPGDDDDGNSASGYDDAVPEPAAAPPPRQPRQPQATDMITEATPWWRKEWVGQQINTCAFWWEYVVETEIGDLDMQQVPGVFTERYRSDAPLYLAYARLAWRLYTAEQKRKLTQETATRERQLPDDDFPSPATVIGPETPWAVRDGKPVEAWMGETLEQCAEWQSTAVHIGLGDKSLDEVREGLTARAYRHLKLAITLRNARKAAERSELEARITGWLDRNVVSPKALADKRTAWNKRHKRQIPDGPWRKTLPTELLRRIVDELSQWADAAPDGPRQATETADAEDLDELAASMAIF